MELVNLERSLKNRKEKGEHPARLSPKELKLN